MDWSWVVVLLLDLGRWSGHFTLSTDLLGFKFFPKLLELHVVALNVEGVIYDKKIFLVVAAGLIGPVKGASHNELTINDHEFVVHVVRRSVVSSAVDSDISHSLDVASIGKCTLVICDYPNFDAGFVSSDHSIGEVVISHGKDANKECLLCAGDVLANFFNVSLVGEEEGIHILGLSGQKVILNNLNKFLKVFKHLLSLIIVYLLGSRFKKHFNCLINSCNLVSLGHLTECNREVFHVQIVETEIFALSCDVCDCFMGSSDSRGFTFYHIFNYGMFI